ncbi:MAG: sigma-70 family RNA polymerase sigma factor [Oscillospiraceae bacterium]|nr:sigma-70 family RNA polymerase sigma factor [Oscillospiraceae bacterium]
MNQINVLTKLDTIRQELHCQQQKILSLEEAARYLSPAGESIGSGGPSDRVGKIASQIADERSKLEELEERYSNAVTDAAQILERLSDPLEKEVLTIRYIAGGKWEEVAKKVDCAVSTCYRIQRRAIKNVQKVDS